MMESAGATLLSRREKYKFTATVAAASGATFEVTAKLYFPEEVAEHPRLLLLPSEAEVYFELEEVLLGPCAVTADFPEERAPAGAELSRIQIEAERCRLAGGSLTDWPGKLAEAWIEARPERLTVRRRFLQPSDQTSARGFFLLSPSLMLQPGISRHTHYNGQVKLKRYDEMAFVLGDQLQLKFRHSLYFENDRTRRNDIDAAARS